MSNSTSYIPYGRQSIDEDDISAVCDVLRSDFITQGPKISEFETLVANKVNAKYGVAVATGTAALHCACYAAGIGEGDEIITSPITFAASGNCALYLGATVRFCDVKPDTYCMDVTKLEDQITDRTKAIVAVDFTGQPCDMDEIIAIARKHNLIVIEDAAHAIGAQYRDRMVGSVADMTIFSFHPVKHVATGEGGMVVTNNEQYYKKILQFRTHGITNDDVAMINSAQACDNQNQFNKQDNAPTRAPWYYEMQELGYNYRITDIQCALGIAQFGKLDAYIEKRRKIAQKYNEAFASVSTLRIPFQEDDRKSAWHLYVLQIQLESINKTRRQIFEELRELNIGVHVHYIPLHLMPFYKAKFGFKRGDFPVSEKYYDAALTVPLYPDMSEEEVQRVIDGVLKVVR